MDFDDANLLCGQYLKSITKHFDASTILIVDDSDISKAKSRQLQYLCIVRDGSTGQTTTGYCYAGVSALTEKHKQPLPVYGHVYSTVEESYKSNNHKTLKSFIFLSAHFPKTTIRALDRGYDAWYVFDYFMAEKESFIVRMKDRTLLYNGKELLLKTLASKFKGKYALKFKGKNGKKPTAKYPLSRYHCPNILT